MQQREINILTTKQAKTSRGNTYSGFVALALLAMFALALVSSELDSANAGTSAPIASVIAGQ